MKKLIQKMLRFVLLFATNALVFTSASSAELPPKLVIGGLFFILVAIYISLAGYKVAREDIIETPEDGVSLVVRSFLIITTALIVITFLAKTTSGSDWFVGLFFGALALVLFGLGSAVAHFIGWFKVCNGSFTEMKKSIKKQLLVGLSTSFILLKGLGSFTVGLIVLGLLIWFIVAFPIATIIILLIFILIALANRN